MPIFDYECPICGARREELFLSTDPPYQRRRMVVCGPCTDETGGFVWMVELVSAPAIAKLKTPAYD